MITKKRLKKKEKEKNNSDSIELALTKQLIWYHLNCLQAQI